MAVNPVLAQDASTSKSLSYSGLDASSAMASTHGSLFSDGSSVLLNFASTVAALKETFPLPVPGEVFFLKRAHIDFKLTGPTNLKASGGVFFLSSRRIVFVKKGDVSKHKDFSSFELPLHLVSEPKFEQPIFGANYMRGKVQPLESAENPLSGTSKWSLTFNAGGCGTFLNVFYKLWQYAIKHQPPSPELVQQLQLGNSAAFVDPNDPSTIYVTQPVPAGASPAAPAPTGIPPAYQSPPPNYCSLPPQQPPYYYPPPGVPVPPGTPYSPAGGVPYAAPAGAPGAPPPTPMPYPPAGPGYPPQGPYPYPPPGGVQPVYVPRQGACPPPGVSASPPGPTVPAGDQPPAQ